MVGGAPNNFLTWTNSNLATDLVGGGGWWRPQQLSHLDKFQPGHGFSRGGGWWRPQQLSHLDKFQPGHGFSRGGVVGGAPNNFLTWTNSNLATDLVGGVVGGAPNNFLTWTNSNLATDLVGGGGWWRPQQLSHLDKFQPGHGFSRGGWLVAPPTTFSLGQIPTWPRI